jgi:hypothetical protein
MKLEDLNEVSSLRTELLKGVLFLGMWIAIIAAIASNASDCRSPAEEKAYQEGWR